MPKLSMLNDLIIYHLLFYWHYGQTSYKDITCIARFIFKQICIDLNNLLSGLGYEKMSHNFILTIKMK